MVSSLHDNIVISTDFRQINSPAFYDCVVHLICTAGKGSFTYNGSRFSIAENEIAVISQPQSVKEIETTSDMICEYVVAPEKFLHNLLPANNYSISGCVSLFSDPIIKVTPAEAEDFIDDINNIRKRMNHTGHRFYTEMMGSLLETMIYDLFEFHSKFNENILTTDRTGYITREFFNLIEGGKPRTQREVSYYAEQLHITPKYLSDTIKRITGHSVTTHINRSAAAIIIAYLQDSRLSITQIADEMNFTSISYFSRYCTKHLGMSPAEYRSIHPPMG